MLPHSRHRPHIRPPPRRRGPRAQTACISCKERKLKVIRIHRLFKITFHAHHAQCDDQVPSCANCQRLDLGEQATELPRYHADDAPQLALSKILLPSASYLETTSRPWRNASSFLSVCYSSRAKSANRNPRPGCNHLALATSTTSVLPLDLIQQGIEMRMMKLLT